MTKPIRKAVFPVAGFGTRFLPATKAVPKELLPVVDKPLIQYAVDEALAAGIEQMIFVTGRGKGAIEDYFDSAFEIEADLVAKKKDAILDRMTQTRLGPGQSAFIRQQTMSGLGHAVWCARHLTGDEPFAVLLPDELLWNRDKPCLTQMMDTYKAHGGSVIAVVDVPREHTSRYGIVDPGEIDGAAIAVNGFVEKPKPDEAPSTLAAVGRYILDPLVMHLLEDQERGAGNEVQLTDALAKLIGRQPFHAHVFAGDRHDCGEKIGFIQANLALALEREDMAEPLLVYMAKAVIPDE